MNFEVFDNNKDFLARFEELSSFAKEVWFKVDKGVYTLKWRK